MKVVKRVKMVCILFEDDLNHTVILNKKNFHKFVQGMKKYRGVKYIETVAVITGLCMIQFR